MPILMIWIRAQALARRLHWPVCYAREYYFRNKELLIVLFTMVAARHALTFKHTHTHMYVDVPSCNSNPMTASRAQPPKVPSVTGNTQADDILPSIGARGGAKYRIRLGLV